jgi:hypothetical protein
MLGGSLHPFFYQEPPVPVLETQAETISIPVPDLEIVLA